MSVNVDIPAIRFAIDLILKTASNSVRNNPEPGDRIEIKRGHYSHWGVYTGDGMIVHMRGLGNARIPSQSEHVFTIFGAQFSKVEIVEERLCEVISGDRAYINNYRDCIWREYKPLDIVQRAKQCIGKEIKYNVLFSNCESFTNWCRYGEWHSDQVGNMCLGIIGAVDFIYHWLASFYEFLCLCLNL